MNPNEIISFCVRCTEAFLGGWGGGGGCCGALVPNKTPPSIPRDSTLQGYTIILSHEDLGYK